MSGNMHYKFNVEYFGPLYECEWEKTSQLADKFARKNKDIFGYCYEGGESQYTLALEKELNECGFETQGFSLYTQYPGLVYGTGYPHNVKADGAITVGQALDFVSGLPSIEGSSIKGLLRSYFPEEKKDLREELQQLLRELTGRDSGQEIEMKDIEHFFEEEDVFLGAFPVIENNNGRILASEFITPHDPDNLKNPIPIAMIKVKPGVQYRFLFQLSDSILENGTVFTKEEKLSLYQNLILLGGAGAKTNVGFGRFSDKAPVAAIMSGQGNSKRKSDHPTKTNSKAWEKREYVFVVKGYKQDKKTEKLQYLILEEESGGRKSSCPYKCIKQYQNGKDASCVPRNTVVHLFPEKFKDNGDPIWREC